MYVCMYVEATKKMFDIDFAHLLSLCSAKSNYKLKDQSQVRSSQNYKPKKCNYGFGIFC